MGEIAHQLQQKKSVAPDSKPKHVITNDDIAFSSSTSSPTTSDGHSAAKNPASGTGSLSASSASEIQSRIKAQKQRIQQAESDIKDLQKQIDAWKTSDCTHVLDAETQRNTCDILQKLMAEYDKAKEKLKTEQANLASMQEAARRQGFGNSVYDPN